MFRTLFAAALISFSAPAAMAGHHETTEIIGPAIGADHSGFSAIKSDGTAVTLSDISGDAGAVIVFSRSMAWCPFCQKQAKDLIEATGPLAELGWSLNVITYDDLATLKGFAAKNDVNYNMLSDAGSAMINAFGLRNHDVESGSVYDGIPHPAIVFLGSDGEVKAMLREEGYKDRPPVETVLSKASELSAMQPVD